MAVLSTLSIIWDWLPTLGVFGLLAIFTRIAYNLFFHPLAKVPGPFFASISGIPSWYHALRGDRHIWIWQLAQIYGEKVRIDPNTVLFCSLTAYNDIYNTAANVQRSTFYTALQRTHSERNTITTVDPQTHARKRKLLNLSFTEKSVRAASVFMMTHIDRWIELLTDECDDDGTGWTAPKDFSELANHLVFDIMGDLCFGNSPLIKEPGENQFRQMPHNIANYLMFWYPITRSPFLDLILWLRPRGFDALMVMITPPEIISYYHFVHDSITKRTTLHEELQGKPESQQRLDLFHFLCEAKDPDTGAPAYTKEELWAEANMLIIAGSDTTAITLCGIFFYIVRNQRSLEKLVNEIRSTFASVDDIVPGAKLQSCVYLKACIDEAMRLTPPGPSEMNREVRAGGTTINGEHYPAGVVVGVAAWVQARSHGYGDPYVFRPERWIVDEANGVTAESVAFCKNNFPAFSRGPGKCPGQNMALLELMLTVAKTLYRLDVRKAPGDTLGEGSPDQQWGQRDQNIMQVRDAYISILHGPMVEFRKRKF